ncbi:hypothetical protein Q9290_08755 [Oceanimonas sp. CHS3-5]|uniref:hypothetical protein n=1 Tax=Oceanimonas sp. CHS3-5 TaxID=3068186 RepID=UPI00273E6336|nr:hypothetical protein [Oceanimonas sp. CHS3-5]MDP5292375.1 hypothetical protein [Oceanimonas sp. CHS3-5]
MTRERNGSGPAAEAAIPSAAGVRDEGGRSELAPIFARLLMLQQRTAQALDAGQWGWLSELDSQLQKALTELEPYRAQLNPKQTSLLQRFAEQYRQHWRKVSEQAGELDRQLGRLRDQRQGSLAYDWVSQLEDGA